jgi:hypothetical protein
MNYVDKWFFGVSEQKIALFSLSIRATGPIWQTYVMELKGLSPDSKLGNIQGVSLTVSHTDALKYTTKGDTVGGTVCTAR